MNKYDFEHPNENRGRIVSANSFHEAEKIISSENNGDSWNLIRAWDSNGIKTFDVFFGMTEFPKVIQKKG